MTNNGRRDTFSGEIRVASRIVDYLSSGLYPSPAACLKELINNSYDADATRVDVFVKPDADRIIIQDDGLGLNKQEFVQHFARISESHKRDGASVTKTGRPKIGKIGIGFIAANEICEVMELFSTKKGSRDLLHVLINFSEMRQPLQKRRRDDGDIAKADYEGELLDAKPDEHYTHLFLKNVRGEARQILAGAMPQQGGTETRSLYGMSPESIVHVLKNPPPKTWKVYDPYSETMLHIGLNVPVDYYEDWLPSNLANKVRDLVDEVRRLRFSVYYDGTELRKPIVFAPTDNAFISRFAYNGHTVSASGYFYVQHGTIRPIELHGLLVRIRHAAVGEYDHSFWGFSASESSLIQRWVSAEVWADDRLEDAMNIDRRTLRVAHPAYVELRDAIHQQLRKVLRKARRDIYAAKSENRKRSNIEDALEELYNVADELLGSSARAVARQIIKRWRDEANKGLGSAVLRSYSVPALYRLVIEIGGEFLSDRQLSDFLERLTERLQQ